MDNVVGRGFPHQALICVTLRSKVCSNQTDLCRPHCSLTEQSIFIIFLRETRFSSFCQFSLCLIKIC